MKPLKWPVAMVARALGTKRSCESRPHSHRPSLRRRRPEGTSGWASSPGYGALGLWRVPGRAAARGLCRGVRRVVLG